MSVDQEIQNIYYSIYNINLTLVNIDQGLASALQDMNSGLSIFDTHVNIVASKINDISNSTQSTFDHFPYEWLYLFILLFLVALLVGLSMYLVYYIVKYIIHWKDRYDEYRMWYLKNVMKRPIYDDEVEDYYDDDELESTPPPTYSEYAETSNIYANYHDQLESQRLSTKNINSDLSTLI
ncbi:unnamed protein product [Caenorhabditis bovis]|uniref:Uncharacterized protein n=1 Tax=Caenorhabditis bovis TaxID=2654633 RepID=A0A8S1E6J9_9PELO|nr:unnamed protein product [Caenorhabditis bovis]